MDAYWTEGRDITGWDELGPCVADVGLDPEEARAEVESGAFAREVDASTATAQRHGINAVPAFVFDGRLLVSGAQPHEVHGGGDREGGRDARRGGRRRGLIRHDRASLSGVRGDGHHRPIRANVPGGAGCRPT